MITVKTFPYDNANYASVCQKAQEWAWGYEDDYSEDGMVEGDAVLEETPDYIGEGAERVQWGGTIEVKVPSRFA